MLIHPTIYERGIKAGVRHSPFINIAFAQQSRKSAILQRLSGSQCIKSKDQIYIQLVNLTNGAKENVMMVFTNELKKKKNHAVKRLSPF